MVPNMMGPDGDGQGSLGGGVGYRCPKIDQTFVGYKIARRKIARGGGFTPKHTHKKNQRGEGG